MLEQEAGLSLKVLTKIEEQECERLRSRARVCVSTEHCFGVKVSFNYD